MRRAIEGLRVFVPEGSGRFLRERTLALASNVARTVDPTRIDARLDPRYLYSEVPAVSGRERGVIDFRGVTLQGRTVVIGLKVSEDIHLPMRVVDYWLRVRRHQKDGEFQRQGYFLGRQISLDLPLVRLVAPAVRFHPAAATLLKCLSPEIRMTCIGVNENWCREQQFVLGQ